MLVIITVLQEQRDKHRHQVERRLVIGCEALHNLARCTKERRHAVDGMPFQVRESVVANIGCVLVHDAVQNDALARSIGAHLVNRVLARGRVLVRRLLAGKPDCRGFDAIQLPHDFVAMDSDQRIPQLLGGLLNER